MPRILRRRPRARPRLEVDVGDVPPEAVVVLLHGGPERGFAPTRRWSVPYLRMLPFGRVVRERSGGRIAVVRLRHTQSGWNGGEATALAEARSALDELRRTAPHLRVGLLGHSLGGRTALRLAGAESVRAFVALAPWVPAGEPVEQLVGTRGLVVHGTADLVCPVGETDAYVDRARAAGASLEYERIPGVGHLLLRRAARWHELTADTLVRLLLDDPAGSA